MEKYQICREFNQIKHILADLNIDHSKMFGTTIC